MLNMYVPTIEKPTEQHADWYKGFCTAFNLCQLSNYLLISYLNSYVQEVSYSMIKESSIYKKKCTTVQNSEDHADLIASLDIVDFLEKIIESFSEIHSDHKNKFLCMGLIVEGFHNQEISIDLNEIKDSTSAKSWNKL